MKKDLKILLAGLLAISLGACGSSGSSTKDDQTADAGKEAETEKLPEETKEETLTPDPSRNYTDASQFAGFDTCELTYAEYQNSAKEFSSGEITLGKTLLREHYTGNTSDVRQLEDDSHEEIRDVETIEPGAVGEVRTTWMTLTGNTPAFFVYNSGDEPAPYDECVLVGIENDLAYMLTFANGFSYRQHEGSVMDTDPKEMLVEILGEPYESDISDSNSEYTWRDEKNEHILELSVWSSESVYQIIHFSYRNLSFAH